MQTLFEDTGPHTTAHFLNTKKNQPQQNKTKPAKSQRQAIQCPLLK